MKRSRKFTRWSDMKLLASADRMRIVELCGVAPRSLQDLARLLGLNPGSVHNHVHKLHDAGFLRVAARRVVNGIVERKYECTAKQFDFSEIDPRDKPARDAFVAKDLSRVVLSVLEEDATATAVHLASRVSPEVFREIRARLDSLRAYVIDHDGSGDVQCSFVAAIGRRRPDEGR